MKDVGRLITEPESLFPTYFDFHLWRELVEDDDIDAICEVAKKCEEKGYDLQAFHFWSIAAEYPNGYEAMYKLGMYYWEGKSFLPKDRFAALYWLSQAGEKYGEAARVLLVYYRDMYRQLVQNLSQYIENKKDVDIEDAGQLSFWHDSELEQHVRQKFIQQEICAIKRDMEVAGKECVRWFVVRIEQLDMEADFAFWRTVKAARRIQKSPEPLDVKIKKLKNLLGGRL